MSSIHATRQRFGSGNRPQIVAPRLETGTEKPIRREGKPRSAERDVKRFTAYLTIERGDSPLTVKKYVRAIKRLKAWARRKRKSLAQLTTTDCRRWLIGLAKEAYSASTINVMHSAAYVFFRFMMSEGDLATNPFEPLPYLPKQETLPRVLSIEDVERLMAVPDTTTYTGLLDRAVMELFYSSGMRVAELINLRLENIHLERRLILCLGKRNKQRWLVFGRSAQSWLKRYLKARAGVPGADKSTYAFLKNDGKKLYGTLVWRHIREHGLMAGLKDVSPHVLRHSFATHMHKGGASIRHVQELLGHEDLESTQVYTHLVQAHLRESYDRHHPRASLKHRCTKRRK